MPPVLIAVAIAVAESAAVGFTIGSIVAGVIGVLGSIIMGALAPKPPSANSPGQDIAKANFTQAFKQAITSRKIIYGVTRVAGPYAYIGTTDSNSSLHLIIMLASHEVAAIDEIWVNDVVVPNDYLDSGGNVITGPYNGFLRIKKHLGGSGQVADADMVGEVAEWDSTHVLNGIAYIYCKLKFSQDIWPGGIPNFSAVVRGKVLFDTRDNSNRFSSNIGLFAYDYMSNPDYGFGAPSSNLNADNISAQANICDEIVATANLDTVITAVDTATGIFTLTGTLMPIQLGDQVQIVSDGTYPTGLAAATNYYAIIFQYQDSPRMLFATTLANAMAGTSIAITGAGSGNLTLRRNGEPRYHGAGVTDTAQSLQNNFLDILTGAAARAVYAGGQWRLNVAAWVAPTVTLSEGDFVSAMDVVPKLSLRNRFNQVIGNYISSVNTWQATDYPQVSDSVFITADGGFKLPFRLDLPFTNRALTAQRLAKIELFRSRQEIVFSTSTNMKGLQLQAGDNAMINSVRFGWVTKAFEVTNFQLGADTQGDDSSAPQLHVDLVMRETAEAIFDWSSDLANEVDPAPNSNLPNPFLVPAVTGLSFSSRIVTTAGGDKVYNLVLVWDLSPDAFVANGGNYQIQYKLHDGTTDDDYRPYPPVPGDHTVADIVSSSPNVAYDIRIRAVNNLGVRSGWNTILNAIVGSSGGIGATLDWGDVTTATSFLDWGDHTTAGTFNDWGSAT